MHLFWRMPDHAPLCEVSVDFELLDEPTTPSLYFWALQAGFADTQGGHGAGHFGFQWNRDYRAHRAVCWGGYAGAGGELSGGPMMTSGPVTPSPDGNPNVCGFEWTTNQVWTWRIRALSAASPSATQGSVVWRAEIEDPRSGRIWPIRDLWCRGDRLIDPMVWSEIFARCDDDPVRVRWSRFTATTADGLVVTPLALAVNYQRVQDGGCTNTDARLGAPTDHGKESEPAVGVIQVTNSPRSTPQGATIELR